MSTPAQQGKSVNFRKNSVRLHGFIILIGNSQHIFRIASVIYQQKHSTLSDISVDFVE